MLAALELFKIDLSSYIQEDLLFKDPVLSPIKRNPILHERSKYGDLAGLQAEFDAASYDVGKKLAEGIQAALK